MLSTNTKYRNQGKVKEKTPTTLNSLGNSDRTVLEGILQELPVNRILDRSTGNGVPWTYGIEPKQNHHLLSGCVRTHGRVNVSGDTIKAEKKQQAVSHIPTLISGMSGAIQSRTATFSIQVMSAVHNSSD